MDLICVIDQSAAVAGGLIDIERASLVEIIGMMGERDRLAFVGYHEEAERKCPLITCTSEGKARLANSIQTFNCKGKTSIAKGLLLGVEVLKQRRSLNETATLLLLSGSRNSGDISPIAQCISSLQQGLSNVSVNAIGYGEELDTDLLKALAAQGKGQCCFIKEQSQIAAALRSTICAISAVVAKEISVSLRVKAKDVPCEITRYYPKGTASPITLDVFHANEKKDIVFLLKPLYSSINKPIGLPTVEVTVNYTENDGSKNGYIKSMYVRFEQWGLKCRGMESAKVYSHWFQARGIDYLEDARKLMTQGELDEAKLTISNGIEALRASKYVGNSVVESVLNEMIQFGDSIKTEPEGRNREK
jgi:hypothetical protein